MKKEHNWSLAKKAPKSFFNQFPEFSPIVLQLFYNRGLKAEIDIENFLSPDYEQSLFDPFLMNDMKKAVERIKKAISKKENIVIYGDYDADGITSVACLYEVLKLLGAKNLSYYIPDKNKEGYGLNNQALLELAKQKTNLIITVDCGITSIDEISLAKSKKIDVIITDHHIVPEKLPKAFAILNPKQKKDKYPFPDLAGEGVAFKLAQALLKTKDNKHEATLKWMMDIIGLGTIADVVPLISENRVFAKYGMVVLKKTKNLGLMALMAKSKVNPDKLNTSSISFQIIPRLNVAGRMDHAFASLKLLLTNSYKEAEKISENLNDLNIRRQKMIEQILKEAREEIGVFDWERKILVLSNKDWSNAVLGLVAGRLSDEYNRPVFMIEEGKEESKGSARSIESFNISEALQKCKKYLIKFGGHKQAAGFSLKTKDIEQFENSLCKIGNKQIKKENIVPKISADCEIKLSDISWELMEELEKFEPYGEANFMPNFLIKNLDILETKNIGNGEKHLRLFLTDGQKSIKAIGFGLAHDSLEIGYKVDVIANLDINEWNGTKNIEIKLVDFKVK